MAMVVKNNMTAINTLNTLNKNSSALSKSLQKVSSGMKINSAADDASGYAISERMRVQIRSLDQANQNTQNGSSMMKVAEGAVSSTVEILKTLKEKAVNAANDSNTDSDRQTIQKELDQSIDQINDNANVTFNGKYLVDGSKNTIGDATYTSLSNQSLSVDTKADTKLIDLASRSGDSLEIHKTDKLTVSYVRAGKTHTTTFQVGDNELQDIFKKVEELAVADGDDPVFATAVDNENVRKSMVENKQLTQGEADNFPAYKDQLDKNLQDADADLNGGTKSDGSGGADAVGALADEKNTVSGKVNAFNSAAASWGAIVGLGNTGTGIISTRSIANGDYLDEIAKSDNYKNAGSIDLGTGNASGDVSLVSNNLAKAAAEATAASDDADAAGKVLVRLEDIADTSTKEALKKKFSDAFGGDPSAPTISQSEMSALLTGWSNAAKAVTTAAADMTDAYDIIDNTGAAGASGGDYTAYLAAKVVYNDAKAASEEVNGTAILTGSTVGVAASKDMVTTASGQNAITVTASKAGISSQISGFNISITDSEGNVKKSANAALDAFEETVRAQNKSEDNAISLQVGAKANQSIKVGLTDMRAEALGLQGEDGTKLNISTQAKANAAINVLDNAIQKALDQQTTIGSVESRLEYTSSNLTTASENVQASESTIRDADMAKEMTQYTKNNVLLQAAQSMLAQANQSSSNVLSLLQ